MALRLSPRRLQKSIAADRLLSQEEDWVMVGTTWDHAGGKMAKTSKVHQNQNRQVTRLFEHECAQFWEMLILTFPRRLIIFARLFPLFCLAFRMPTRRRRASPQVRGVKQLEAPIARTPTWLGCSATLQTPISACGSVSPVLFPVAPVFPVMTRWLVAILGTVCQVVKAMVIWKGVQSGVQVIESGEILYE
jgi:hypothetical protein